MRTILDITRRPDVTFFPSGKIDITARVARIMELQRGDVIDIAIDGDEYYLFVKHRAQNVVGCHQATVWPTKERSHNFRCYSRRLCNAMLRTQSTGSEGALRLPAGDPVHNAQHGTMIPLIYKVKL